MLIPVTGVDQGCFISMGIGKEPNDVVGGPKSASADSSEPSPNDCSQATNTYVFGPVIADAEADPFRCGPPEDKHLCVAQEFAQDTSLGPSQVVRDQNLWNLLAGVTDDERI